MSPVARNVLLIVVLAAAVAFVPGGGDSANFVGSFLSIAIVTSLVLIGARLYRENRVAIFSLGDRYRGVLYAALGAFVVAMAAREKALDTGPGTLLWLTLMVGAAAGLFAVYRHYREYSL